MRLLEPVVSVGKEVVGTDELGTANGAPELLELQPILVLLSRLNALVVANSSESLPGILCE